MHGIFHKGKPSADTIFSLAKYFIINIYIWDKYWIYLLRSETRNA